MKPEGNFLFLVNSLLVVSGTPIDPPPTRSPPFHTIEQCCYFEFLISLLICLVVLSLISLREKLKGRKRETEKLRDKRGK